MIGTQWGHVVGCPGIEVICGPMFSGKTEELIRRVRRAQIAKQKVQIFSPKIDIRYSDSSVVSHSAQSMEAVTVDESIPFQIIEKLLDSTRVVAIDEVQFFKSDIVWVIKKLEKRGLRVIVAGLDQDYRGMPFGPMPILLSIASSVTKISAICTICGAPATKTYRLGDQEEQVFIGENNFYEARCLFHWDYPDEDLKKELKEFSLGQESLVSDLFSGRAYNSTQEEPMVEKQTSDKESGESLSLQ